MSKQPRARWWSTLACVAAAALIPALCACAHNTAPIQQDIANAEMIITSAKESGAGDRAPLELRLAEEKLQEAREALKEKEYEPARFLAEQAVLSAKVAEAKAQSEKTKAMVKELRDSIDALSNEILRVQEPQS